MYHYIFYFCFDVFFYNTLNTYEFKKNTSKKGGIVKWRVLFNKKYSVKKEREKSIPYGYVCIMCSLLIMSNT